MGKSIILPVDNSTQAKPLEKKKSVWHIDIKENTKPRAKHTLRNNNNDNTNNNNSIHSVK